MGLQLILLPKCWAFATVNCLFIINRLSCMCSICSVSSLFDEVSQIDSFSRSSDVNFSSSMSFYIVLTPFDMLKMFAIVLGCHLWIMQKAEKSIKQAHWRFSMNIESKLCCLTNAFLQTWLLVFNSVLTYWLFDRFNDVILVKIVPDVSNVAMERSLIFCKRVTSLLAFHTDNYTDKQSCSIQDWNGIESQT